MSSPLLAGLDATHTAFILLSAMQQFLSRAPGEAPPQWVSPPAFAPACAYPLARELGTNVLYTPSDAEAVTLFRDARAFAALHPSFDTCARFSALAVRGVAVEVDSEVPEGWRHYPFSLPSAPASHVVNSTAVNPSAAPSLVAAVSETSTSSQVVPEVAPLLTPLTLQESPRAAATIPTEAPIPALCVFGPLCATEECALLHNSSASDVLALSFAPSGVLSWCSRHALWHGDFLGHLCREGSIWSLRESNVLETPPLSALGYDVVALSRAGLSLTSLRGGGFDANTLRTSTGAGVHELLAAGFSPKELHAAGVTAAALREAGCTALDVRVAGFELEELLWGHFPVSELLAGGPVVASVTELLAARVSLSDLLAAGATISACAAAGVPLSDLIALKVPIPQLTSAFSLLELVSSGVAIKELMWHGATAIALWRTGRVSVHDLRLAGFSLRVIAEAGASAVDLCSAFNASELRAAGYPAHSLRGGLSAGGCLAGGYPLQELLVKESSFSAQDFHVSGVPAALLKGVGVSATFLSEGGYTTAELKAAGYTATELRAAGFTTAELRAAGFWVL